MKLNATFSSWTELLQVLPQGVIIVLWLFIKNWKDDVFNFTDYITLCFCDSSFTPVLEKLEHNLIQKLFATCKYILRGHSSMSSFNYFLWNSIPNDVRNGSYLNIFRSKVKQTVPTVSVDLVVFGVFSPSRGWSTW